MSYNPVKNESEWKTWYAKALRDKGHYARRIEDEFSVGFPDMVIGIRMFAPAFVEVKMIKGGYFEPSPRQYIELVQLHRPPLSYGIVIGVGDDVCFFSLPRKKIMLSDPSTYFAHPNAVTGLEEFLRQLRG